MGEPRVFVHVVTYNSKAFIEPCIRSLLSQEGYRVGDNLTIHVTDNASSDGSASAVTKSFPNVSIEINSSNIGFCGAHNQGTFKFISSNSDFLLILNPDVRLEPKSIGILVNELKLDKSAGMACSKLYRADENLQPINPKVLDSAGMVLTSSLRHFDRGSNDADRFNTKEYVFGGSGACLLLKRSAVKSLLLTGLMREKDSELICPALGSNREKRALLFDEAFFAYREDADLAWRARNLGIRCLFVPNAIGYHKRVVLPENRRSLPPELNRFSVRNRFLLQLNNFSLKRDFAAIIPGLLLRNILVVLGVLLFERSSLLGLRDALKLIPRAIERRRSVFSKGVLS